VCAKAVRMVIASVRRCDLRFPDIPLSGYQLLARRLIPPFDPPLAEGPDAAHIRTFAFRKVVPVKKTPPQVVAGQGRNVKGLAAFTPNTCIKIKIPSVKCLTCAGIGFDYFKAGIRFTGRTNGREFQ